MISPHPIIPVLVYHAVISSDTPAAMGREEGAWLYDLSFEKFKAHMAWLHQQGYCTLKAGEQLVSGKRGVVLTFDDGEMNNFTVAFPILKSLGFQAYFFVTPERVGRPGYMDWLQLQMLVKEGMIVGAHGLTHAVLPMMNDQDLRRELEGAKHILEERLAVSIDTFSVPRGFYDGRVVICAREAGYRDIFISDVDPRWPDQVIGRVAVKAGWSVGRLDSALVGRTPLGEKIFAAIKNSVKRCVSPEIYNRLRQTLLRKQ